MSSSNAMPRYLSEENENTNLQNMTPIEYYAQWNKSDGERQIFWVIAYMWNLENKMNEYNPTEIDPQIQRTN